MKETIKLRITGHLWRDPLVTELFPHKGPVIQKAFKFHVITSSCVVYSRLVILTEMSCEKSGPLIGGTLRPFFGLSKLSNYEAIYLLSVAETLLSETWDRDRRSALVMPARKTNEVTHLFQRTRIGHKVEPCIKGPGKSRQIAQFASFGWHVLSKSCLFHPSLRDNLLFKTNLRDGVFKKVFRYLCYRSETLPWSTLQIEWRARNQIVQQTITMTSEWTR